MANVTVLGSHWAYSVSVTEAGNVYVESAG